MMERKGLRVTLEPTIVPRRGAPVEAGNVYTKAYGKPFFKIVVAVVERCGTRPWNNVIFLHVDALGQICGGSQAPQAYVQNHQDLVGQVQKMPSMKIIWNSPGKKKK